jgi:hypothetical protein
MKIAICSIIAAVSFSLFFLTSCTKSSGGTDGGGGGGGGQSTYGNYSVFAWNDLGMHCLNPSYDKLVILPPYNNVYVQVVKRGSPPQVVTSGVTVSYKLTNNTSSYNKGSFGGFWDNAKKLFNATLVHDIGLKGKGLSGDMTATNNYFVAEGIPVVPYNDGSTTRNPYQVAEITVKDGTGTVVAQTQATVPTSDEINCAKCHGTNAFDDILSKHDSKHGTSLSAAASKPVLCASCHPSPALGIDVGPQMYLSQALHGSHSTRGAACYDCHPGATTKCNRSLAHTADNGNCITCHGEMAVVASSIATQNRKPWVNEPACGKCHTGVTGVIGTTLFKASQGHGNLYCSACHGSPHAMVPSREASDNYQSKQYQGFTTTIKTIGSCGVCHNDSRGGAGASLGDFSDVHGGTNPEKVIGCMACHTSIPTNASAWPHAHTWTNSN